MFYVGQQRLYVFTWCGSFILWCMEMTFPRNKDADRPARMRSEDTDQPAQKRRLI